MDGIANVVAWTAIYPYSYTHTYVNELWYPNAGSAYPGVTSSQFPVRGSGTGTVDAVPTC